MIDNWHDKSATSFCSKIKNAQNLGIIWEFLRNPPSLGPNFWTLRNPHHVTYLNRFRAQNLLSKNMIYWSLVLFGQFYLIFSFRFVSRFKKYFPFLRDLPRKVSIRYRRNQFQRIFWGTQKSQNFNFILEKNLLNKKVVFLHINLALNTQNCQKINFKGCFGP